jgi:L-alanine-DL-glutamate epimerase-like enolase superfamily enzyme
MTALETPRYIGGLGSGARFPISAPVSSDWPIAKIRQTVEARLRAGYDFIKVKVGRDLNKDSAAARCVLTEWPGLRFGVVFDANQAHTFDEALSFARVLHDCASDRLQWYEQPLDRRDWHGLTELCRVAAVPIVLDESIYDRGHIARAAAMGAFGIKLKLVKNFGITETLALARAARSAGLAVVFGNGVASDIGNLGEYLTLAEGQSLFAAPSESSGFAKLTTPLLGNILSITSEGHFISTEPAEHLDRLVRAFVDAHVAAV